MPGIRNVLPVEPTDEVSINAATSTNWPLIELYLLLLVLMVLIGAILVSSLWCTCTSSNTIRQQQEVGKRSSISTKQQRPHHCLRNGLHVTILLIGAALSIVTHFSCTMLRLDESPSDEIQAIGIWKVWHIEYNVCLDVAVVGGFQNPASGSDTRALAVLATLFGVASLLFLLYGSTEQNRRQAPPSPDRVQAIRMAILLSAVCGVGAVCLQGSALVTVHHSDACEDYQCRNKLDTGAIWPILAILYWIAGLVVTLFLTVQLVQQQVVVVGPVSDDNNKGASSSFATTKDADALDQAASHAGIEDRTDAGDCRRRSILSSP